MGNLKNFVFKISALLPHAGVRSFFGNDGLLPYHHLVSDNSVRHIKHLYSFKSVEQFRLDLKYLLKHYRPVEIDELVYSVRNGEGLPKNSFILTFDDGLKEIYDIVAPILLENGISAIYFVNPAYIGNKDLFYRSKISLVIDKLKSATGKDLPEIALMLGLEETSLLDSVISALIKITSKDKDILEELGTRLNISYDQYLADEAPYLTKSQISELAREGFSIGAHSWNHPYYDLLEIDEMIKETTSSLDYVQDNFSQPFKLFSFPHIDKKIPQSFFDQLKIQENIDIIFGTQNQKNECNNNVLHRFNSERPQLSLSNQANGIHLYLGGLRFFGRNRVRRRN